MFQIIPLVLLVLQCQANEISNERPVLFEHRDNGLAWPLPDNSDPGMQIIHGIHCFDVIQEDPINSSDHMSVMHQQHCRGVIKRVLTLLEANPSYEVNEWICKAAIDTRKERSWGQFCYQGCWSPSQYYSYCGNFCYGRRKRSNDPLVIRQNQAKMYIKLAASNFGNLLMKNYTNPQSLNAAEAVYLQQWESRKATALAAIGVYCQVKGRKDDIRDTLYPQP